MEDVRLVSNQWALQIAEQAPLAIRAAKKAMLEPGLSFMQEGLRAEISAYEEIIGTKDRREGLQALLEKRIPHYEGN